MGIIWLLLALSLAASAVASEAEDDAQRRKKAALALFGGSKNSSSSTSSSSNTRTNHAGRVLPPLPPIKAPVMFNAPEADDILDAMQVFPVSNAWNEDISKLPVHPNSEKIVRNVGWDTNLHVDVSENLTKKYGMIVADNGRDWDICAAPDKRIHYEQMRALHKLKGSDFEVVVTTGEKEGPRVGGR